MMKKGLCSFLLVLYTAVFLSSCLSQGVKKASASDLEAVQILKLKDTDYGSIYISGIISPSGVSSESK